MPWATKIEVCPAVCPVIRQNDAYYTHKKDKMAYAEIASWRL